jgi:hypothetical protein
MKDNLKSLKLLDQIIDFEEWLDRKHKQAAIEKHNASQSVGESWTLQHLKNLKELIITEHAKGNDNRPRKKEE